MGLAPSKKTNVLFLEKIAPLRVTHAGVRCEDSAQRKTNKMASEITFVEGEEIQFQFLDSDSGFKDYTSESDDGSENISDKPCGEGVSDMSDEDISVRRQKSFAGKKGVDLRKNR